MEKLVIKGGNRLVGTIEIGGAKNAAVAIIPATLLAKGVCILENVPDISDTRCMFDILKEIGAEVEYLGSDKHTVRIDTTKITSNTIHPNMAKQLRASCYFIGALLGRGGKAKVALPGGCNFGTRPIDLHIKGFELLDATTGVDDGSIVAEASALTGAMIYMDKVSVGATVNVMLAAVRAKGLTIIENAAREPHIVDLANFLNAMGADVRGAGTDVIKIRGVSQMHGCEYSIIPDQIEAGTYMVAAAATGGDVVIDNVIPKHLESISAKLRDCGIKVIEGENSDSVRVISDGKFKSCNVTTMPHPGFPTDMQPQMAVILCLADGVSVISERVWNDRFRYIEQLKKMGADIKVDGTVATFKGVEKLKGATIKSDDLRAGAAMIIAGLVAEGETTVEEIIYIDRGYEDYIGKLAGVGADIRRVKID